MKMRETSRVRDKKLADNHNLKYHPHSQDAVYGAMVVMAQDFKQGRKLIDGHGKQIAVLNEPIK